MYSLVQAATVPRHATSPQQIDAPGGAASGHIAEMLDASARGAPASASAAGFAASVVVGLASAGAASLSPASSAMKMTSGTETHAASIRQALAPTCLHAPTNLHDSSDGAPGFTLRARE